MIDQSEIDKAFIFIFIGAILGLVTLNLIEYFTEDKSSIEYYTGLCEQSCKTSCVNFYKKLEMEAPK